jgi:beta-N-acetylhexosaminidase
MRLVVALTLALALSLAATACTGSATSPNTVAEGSPTPSPTPTAPPDPIAGMTLAQQVGQLFMVGTTASAPESETLKAIRDRHLGNIFLSGRSTSGVAATAKVVARFTALVNANSTEGLPLLVATDQEGGYVQTLQGPGFTRIPAALTQGSMTSSALASASQKWGAQLAAAGVNMNLGPVVDLVPSAGSAPGNPPIGAIRREFGFSATTIISHANAIRKGMTASGVITTLKHFPGLGYVRANTDYVSGVTDRVVTTSGVDAKIYRKLIAEGAPCIMVSSAIYARIDPKRPALFSTKVVTGMLRQKLGFTGVIVTDDLSGAAQIASWSSGKRAVLAITAGVDIVLVSRTPKIAAHMMDTVLKNAESDPQFAALVGDAARRVVILKASLLTASG